MKAWCKWAFGCSESTAIQPTKYPTNAAKTAHVCSNKGPRPSQAGLTETNKSRSDRSSSGTPTKKSNKNHTVSHASPFVCHIARHRLTINKMVRQNFFNGDGQFFFGIAIK